MDTAAGLPGQGFAAVKITALGNPKLLERTSSAILTVRGLFARYDLCPWALGHSSMVYQSVPSPIPGAIQHSLPI